MNEKNECIILGTRAMEEREGAPGLPSEGRASAGPITILQISQNDNVELVERMDESPDGVTASSSVKLELSAVSPARQKSPAHLLTRTNASVSNCVVSSPTKMILDPSVSTFQSVVCAKSASGTSQAPVNSSTLSCINNSFAMSKKRLKVSESLEKVTACDDISGLRRRILEHKLARLKSIRERHNENAAELFYLQSGGNMMDYQTWRKRPPTPQLLAYIRSHRLETAEEPDDRESSHASNQSNAVHSAPQGAEIKIPGVGATPVAISTTLPAAVAQLTQQGSVPGRPAGGRHGMVFAPHRHHSPVATPRLPGGTPLVIENSGVTRTSVNHTATPTTPVPPAPSSQEQIVEKAKQEAFVMQRISELQKEGLWTEKRLPKVVEPSRPKAHWDYLLEEMVWLATDFAQERKWKKAAAKKCARMIQKYFQEKELSSQKAEKAQEHQLRRIASFIAKEVRLFWTNVEKLVEYRQQTRLEEKRKQALDQQLNFIVDQTEKYSQQLAEGLRTQIPVSKQSSSKASSTSYQSDGEFCPSNVGSSDDEETIDAAEKAEREETGDHSHKDEIEALQRESQMDLDEFLKELPQDYLENRDKINLSEDEDDKSSAVSNKKEDDSEFQADGDSSDDEDTIMEQEKLENQHDYEKEIDELNAENEMSIEELKKKYSGAPPENDVEMIVDDENVESQEKNVDKEKASDSEYEEESEDDESVASDNTEEGNESEGLDALMGEGGEITEKQNADEHRMEDAAAIAESIQPTGNTLSSTQVVTNVPFLLKHSLREYQHIGLDWLVTMEQRRLNGILADEMGLGKTIQTIALLAHLACEKGDWGPHLIVVPTSVMLNWEMEFKKWCPGFKILTYYGNQKERKLKRIGWTKFNAFHICVTSYKLVIQDHQSFRRKKWKYLILDEAQNIKNFKSQRWQLLLNFKTQQRLLLTGTPLQNNLMELWSLMHFLMPDVFASHNEFKEWFSNPVTGMIEGNSEYNENVIKRLHKVLRPFLLRRLKCEVEKQMPKKFEHVVICRLSKRQRFLYDDFMSRAKTKETLASGNLLSVINVLMQLRKVCNHPNLFEVRPTISPFQMEGVNYYLPSLICNMKKPDPLEDFDVSSFNMDLLKLESCSAFESYRVQQLKVNENQISKIDSSPLPPPPCPRAALRIHVTLRPIPLSSRSSNTGVAVGTSPRMPPSTMTNLQNAQQNIMPVRQQLRLPSIKKTDSTQIPSADENLTPHTISVVQPLTARVLKQLSTARTAQTIHSSSRGNSEKIESKRSGYFDASIDKLLKDKRKTLLNFIYDTNEKRCSAYPLYGCDLREACTIPSIKFCDTIQKDINTVESYLKRMHQILDRFIIFICGAMSPGIRFQIGKGAAWRTQEERRIEYEFSMTTKPLFKLFHQITTHMTTQFPDPRLIQYDCGKLQTLDLILRKLKSGNHKVLIFTQMTKMLDVLEAFLNFHGHIYLRLDGTTRVEQRQILMERFNADKRIFAFILSTRSGGVGVNLTGADTVIFYDSDWNPTMDAQAQDRCHRIGQTRDVHIYRLISEKTIEENILKKANQKRLLGDVAIEGGNFTTAYFKSSSIQDLFTVGTEEDAGKRMEVSTGQEEVVQEAPKLSELADSNAEFENALAQCEDEADVAAATTARAEADAELAEFDESIPIEEPLANPAPEPPPELSKAEQELEQLMQELSPIERYGIRLVEASEAATFAEQQAIAEMEKQKREWETARRLLERSPTPPEPETNNDDLLTFSREDSINQVWISSNTNEIMAVWYPPTPPQGEGDIYVDTSLAYLYDWNIMLETDLPPVYIKRDNKRPRVESGHSPDSRRPPKLHRREEAAYTPRSLFERPAPALIKMRRDLKLQKYRNIIRPPLPVPGIKPLPKPQSESDSVLEWTLSEDKCILDAVRSQGLPLNLIILSPALTPNWDLVADLVNNTSRIYRSPRQCKNRYENIILPREEGKSLMDANQKKQKKSKSSHKSSRLMRTSHLYEQDNNASFTKDVIARHDIMKTVLNKKTATPKRRYNDPNIENPKHVAVLSECGINYDKPSNPMDIAAKRAERIAKEKQKNSTVAATIVNEQVVAPSRLQNVTKTTSSPPLGTASPTHAVANVAATTPSPRPPQRVIQADQLQRQQRIVVTPQQGTSAVVKGSTTGTLTAGGKPLNQAQIQFYRQQAALRQQLKVFTHVTTGAQQNNIVQQIGVAQQVGGNKIAPVTVTSIQVSSPQQRPQIAQSIATVGNKTLTRAVTEVDINALLLKRQQALLQKNPNQQPVTQIFASQQQLQNLQAGSSERVAVSVGGATTIAVASGNMNMTNAAGTKITGTGVLTGVATALSNKTPLKMATAQQIRQLQLQQQLALAQRKGQKVNQITQGAGGTQVIVQAQGTHKALPPGMTMQQIQQAMRQIPQAGARVLPRQTIQLVGGNVGQVRTGVAGTTGHQVILSQVSAALQARQPTPTSTANVRPPVHSQTPPDPQPKT